MPKSNRYYNSLFPKKAKRSKRKHKSMISAPAKPLGNQKAQKFKFRYCTSDILNPQADGPDHVEYVANGMWDPETAIGGHQPIGFDNYVGVLYDHYTVTKATITVEACSTTSVPSIVGIQLSDAANQYSSGDNAYARERPNNMWKALSVTTGGNDKVKLQKTFIAKSFFGANVLAGSIYRGNSTNNPTEMAYFNVYCTGVGITSDPGNIEVAVTIDYEAVLTEPIPMAQS